MSERLDLSDWLYKWTNKTHSRETNDDACVLMNEALRAQASEDALRERVRRMEEAINAVEKSVIDCNSHRGKLNQHGEFGVQIISNIRKHSALGGGKESEG